MTFDENIPNDCRYAAFNASGELVGANVYGLSSDKEPIIIGQTGIAEYLSLWLKTYQDVEGHKTDNDKDVQHLINLWREPEVALNAYDHKGQHFLLTNHGAPNNNIYFVGISLERWRTRPDAYISLKDATSTINTLDEGLVLWKSGRFMLCNQKYLEIFNLDQSQTSKFGQKSTQFIDTILDGNTLSIPDDVSPNDFQNMLLTFTNEEGNSAEFQCTDGRVLKFSTHLTTFGSICCRVQDITTQKEKDLQAENMSQLMDELTVLKEAEKKKLEAVTDLLQATDDTLALFDQDLNFVLANDRWYDVHYTGIRPKPQPGESFDQHFRILVEDGFYMIPEGVSNDEFIEYVKQVARTYTKDVPFLLTDGRTYLGGSHETRLGGYLISSKDTTEKTRATEEFERQRELAHQNEKLSALGELLAGVAHELNNPLSVVFGYSQMLQGKVDDPKIAERLQLISQSAERAAKIVKMFLAMARQRPMKVAQCSINDIIRTVYEVSSYSLKSSGTEIILELDDSIPFISGDFDQLTQVFSNLMVNAGHALQNQGKSGVLQIRSYFDPKTEQVTVEVRDNGPGIPKDIQNRIFEPFYTTKDVGEGTGVGLSFCHRIIESHGGVLELESKVGEGASFFVRLAADAQDLVESPVHDQHPRKNGNRSILVVDDEAGVAQLICDLLEDRGFSVTKSTAPSLALKILEHNTFDAILSDFKMPNMDGEDFFNALAIVAPECVERIGFITGDTMGQKVREFFKKSHRPFIEKPIEAKELIDLVDGLCGLDFKVAS